MHKLMEEVLISPTNVKDTSFFRFVPKGLSSYHIVIAGKHPFKELMWMEWTPKAMHTFVYSSSISSLQPQQNVELVELDLNDGALKTKGLIVICEKCIMMLIRFYNAAILIQKSRNHCQLDVICQHRRRGSK